MYGLFKCKNKTLNKLFKTFKGNYFSYNDKLKLKMFKSNFKK